MKTNPTVPVGTTPFSCLPAQKTRASGQGDGVARRRARRARKTGGGIGGKACFSAGRSSRFPRPGSPRPCPVTRDPPCKRVKRHRGAGCRGDIPCRGGSGAAQAPEYIPAPVLSLDEDCTNKAARRSGTLRRAVIICWVRPAGGRCRRLRSRDHSPSFSGSSPALFRLPMGIWRRPGCFAGCSLGRVT